MKSYLMFILIIFLGGSCMFDCSNDELSKIKIGESVLAAKEVYGSSFIDLNTVNVFKDENKYVITISDFQNVLAIAIFGSDGKLLCSKGVEPIDDKNIEQFLGKSVADLENQFGKIHCDTGSGFYIPAYITDHATIVTLHVENDIVVNISSIDILTLTQQK